MDERLVRGLPWTYLTFGATRAITFTTTIILGRLLVPDDFGIVALGMLTVTFVSVFSNAGLGAALVVTPDLDRRAQGTVLSLLVATGVVTAAAFAAASPLAADLLDEPRLTGILAALAATIALGGVNWFYESVLQRELAFRYVFQTQFARAVGYAVVTIGCAAAGAGVWSLVAGQIAQFVAYSIALLLVVPERIPPAFDPRAARQVLRTGRGFVFQGAAQFLQQNIDYLVVGRRLGTERLGLYSMAYQQSELPTQALAVPVARVTFPGFARMSAEGQDIRPSFLRVLELVTAVAAPAAILLSACAGPFTEALLGERWLPMVGALAVLGARGVTRAIESNLSWMLNSTGHAEASGRLALVGLVPLFAGIVAAATHGSITTVAWVMFAHNILIVAVLAVLVTRFARVPMARQLAAVSAPLVAAAADWGVSRAVVGALDLSPWPTLLLAAGAGTATYVAVLLALRPRLLGDAAALWRRARRRPPAAPSSVRAEGPPYDMGT